VQVVEWAQYGILIKFHPTAFMTQKQDFLISESPFVAKVANYCLPEWANSLMSSLIKEKSPFAPRTIVARAIDHEMKALAFNHVLPWIFSHKIQNF